MPDLSELITVCVTTSPTASDPDMNALVRTTMSITGLHDCSLLFGADGVRPEQRHLTERYEEKLAAVQGFCDMDPANNRLLRLPAWGHQANVMRMLLAEVKTPLVLCLEHDTPLTPNVKIDWETAAECIRSRELDLIRFLHESAPLAEHAHLFLDRTSEPQYFGTMPVLRTAQWSQRPHLAHTLWYKLLIDRYSAPSSRCFIEDVMHGVVATGYREEGIDWWKRFRLSVYADPEPTMQRSFHLDGRGGEPKGGQVFAYPGETPKYAPAATLGRTFE